MPTYTVTIESTLRTATINEKFSDSLSTASIPASATPIAQRIITTISNGSLDAKSIQGTISFSALAGRSLGGQARYSTSYVAGTPVAAAHEVEPEHRISFAIAPGDWVVTGITGTQQAVCLAGILQSKINEGLYENSLYRHQAS
jgi:hypothetical protein